MTPGEAHGPPPSTPWQSVLNEDWPLSDRNGRHARGIPDQPKPIDVEVRLELSEDGERWFTGRATRWTRSHVYVTGIADAPIRTGPGVWVRAHDVRRRRQPS